MSVETFGVVPVLGDVKVAIADGEGCYPALFATSYYQHELDDVPISPLFLWREISRLFGMSSKGGYVCAGAEARADFSRISWPYTQRTRPL